MIVKIASSIYGNKKHFDILDQIIPIFQSGKHIWDIQDPQEILDSEWMNIEAAGTRQRKRVDDLIKMATKNGLYTGKRKRESKITILIVEEGEERLSCKPAYALEQLKAPLYIIVENSNSDRAFLEAIAIAYNRKEILEAIKKEWIEFDTEGGGGGIPRRIEHHYNKKFVPRLFVLVDSDREFPDDNHKVDKVVGICEVRNIVNHVLFKRAIENYIPFGAIDERPSFLAEIIIAYNSLNDEQKDYFDLKKGFKNKGKPPETQKDLFGHVNSKDPIFKALRKGFNVGGGFNPNHLYQFFEGVSIAALEKRTKRNPQELEQILNKISGLL